METLLAQIQADLPAQPDSATSPKPQVVAAPAQEPSAAEADSIPADVAAAPALKSDEMSITLAPGEGAEVKLEMRAGARANYRWSASGNVNFDAHGDGGGQSAYQHPARSIDPVDLENALRQVQTDRANFLHGRLP